MEANEAPGSHSPTRIGLPLMPELAIAATLLLVAAPVVLVGGTMWLALKKQLAARRAQHPAAQAAHRSMDQPG